MNDYDSLMRALSRTDDDAGATAIEYSIVASAIVIVIVSSLRLIGNRLASIFATVTNAI